MCCCGASHLIRPAHSGSVRAVQAGPVTRRRFVAGAGLLVAAAVTGCTDSDDPTAPAADRTLPATEATGTGQDIDPTTPPDAADADLVAAVLQDEDRLVTAYRIHGVGRPDLRRELDTLADHHRSHLRVLGGAPAQAAPTTPRVSPAVGVRRLRQLEAGAVEQRRRDAVAARSGDLARVLAAMAASSAQHVVVLERLALTFGKSDRS